MDPFDILGTVGIVNTDQEEEELEKSRDTGTDSRDHGGGEGHDGQYDVSLIDDVSCFDTCYAEGIKDHTGTGMHTESSKHRDEHISEKRIGAWA